MNKRKIDIKKNFNKNEKMNYEKNERKIGRNNFPTEFKEYSQIEKIDIKNIEKDCIGEKFNVIARIENIAQTSGPTLFILFDGTGNLTAKSFAGAGQRAYPNLNIGDIIDIIVEIREHNNEIEAEIESCKTIPKENFDEILENKIKDYAKPIDTNFMIKSPILDLLKTRMLEAATQIRRAIIEGRPIYLRHHADCDGYCGAIAIERAILPLINDNNEKDMWKLYKRLPSKSPFYEISDVTKDLSMALEDMDRFGKKEPLVIIVDNGSTNEDIFAIKKLKIYGAKIVVIDHHYPGKINNGKSEVDNYVDVHVNPYLVGGDSNLCAGMLGCEISRMLYDKTNNIKYLAALSGTSDRCKGEEFKQYLEIAKEKGYTKEYLLEVAECVDFEAHYIRFMESRGLVNDLLGQDREKQEKLVKLMIEDINERKDKQIIAAKYYSKATLHNDVLIVEINASEITNRGEYPAIGKTVGMLHDLYLKENKKVITIGYGEDFITLRASDDVNFNVNNIVEELKNKIPHTFSDGGGHEHAGTVKFVVAAGKEVKEFVISEIKRMN